MRSRRDRRPRPEADLRCPGGIPWPRPHRGPRPGHRPGFDGLRRCPSTCQREYRCAPAVLPPLERTRTPTEGVDLPPSGQLPWRSRRGCQRGSRPRPQAPRNRSRSRRPRGRGVAVAEAPSHPTALPRLRKWPGPERETNGFDRGPEPGRGRGQRADLRRT